MSAASRSKNSNGLRSTTPLVPGRVELNLACFRASLKHPVRDPLKHPIGHTGMQIGMPVDRRAKAMLKGDRTESGTGLPGCGTDGCNTCCITK